ncbi:MAG TPA: tetratricopeptide repeat protein [Verrucomicrobiae bacterium]|nr:tetratricopeptide repeat protein [Verrucomicrobiae bacterium]
MGDRLIPAGVALLVVTLSLGSRPLLAQQMVFPGAPAAQPTFDPDKELRTLNALFIGKEFAQAAAGYIDFLRDYPASPAAEEVYYKLGDCYRQLGRTADAVDAFDRLLKQFPKGPYSPFALARKGEVLLEGGRPAEAMVLFDEVLARAESPGLQLNAKFSKVRALRALGRARDAVPLLEELASVEDNNPYRAYAALSLARYLESEGKPNEAMGLYQVALQIAQEPALRAEAGVRAGNIACQLKDWNEAASLFETIRRLSAPDEWHRFANLGIVRARFSAGQYDAVLQLYPEVKTMLPSGTEAEALYAYANSLRLRGRQADAAAAYQRILDADAKSAFAEPAAYERILCLSSTAAEEIGQAAEAFLKQFPSSDKLPAIRYVRANFLFDRRGFAEAIPLLEQIVRDGKPESAQEVSLFRLGWALHAGQRWKESADAYGKLLARFPKTRFAPDALWQLGSAHEQMKEPEAAIAAWSQLAERFPDSEQGRSGLFQMALLEAREGRFPDSRRHLGEFLDRNPSPDGRADALYWRGWAAFEAQDYAAAVTDLLAARDAKPEWYGPATERLVFATYKLQRPEELAQHVREWDVWLARHPGEGQATNPAAILWLANALAAKGLWEDAEIFQARVAESGIPALRADGLLGAGRAQLKLGKFASAVRTYEAFRSENPDRANDARVMLDLARAYVGAGRASETSALAQQVMREHPEGEINAEARILLGDALMALGQADEAAKYFSSVTLLYDLPAFTLEALSKAAEAHERAGNKAEAEKFRKEWAERRAKAQHSPAPPGGKK